MEFRRIYLWATSPKGLPRQISESKQDDRDCVPVLGEDKKRRREISWEAYNSSSALGDADLFDFFAKRYGVIYMWLLLIFFSSLFQTELNR